MTMGSNETNTGVQRGERLYRWIDLVPAAFVAVLLISNIASTKILLLGPFTFDGRTILFPLATSSGTC